MQPSKTATTAKVTNTATGSTEKTKSTDKNLNPNHRCSQLTNQNRTCQNCERFKVPNSGCTYTHEISQRTILPSDQACEDYLPKNQDSKKEQQLPHKACGLSEEGYYEAIYHQGKPAFLVLNKQNLSVKEKVTIDGKSHQPKEYPNEFPYEPYGYSESAVPSREDLFWKVREEFNLFLDLEPIWKGYLAACVLLSYQQEKTRTVPYVYFVGDNESGKTVALSLFNWLCYRPMLGVTIPSADTYGYLDESEAPGVILEDEAQGLYKDLDKAKIYKAGYKQGAVVPRTMITHNKRFIKYFRVFCFKACAAEEMPRVKGLLERFIFIPMTEGYPRKDWADLNKEDETRFRQLRNILLKWRLLTREEDLPEVQLPVKGRLKELWKPIIQVVSCLTVEKDLRAQIEHLQQERLDEKVNTLEGHIVKVVCELYVPGTHLLFVDVWDALVEDLEGKLDDKKPNKMDTSDFGEITKQKVGYRIREVLNGKKEKVKKQSERAYCFDVEKLARIAKKYAVSLRQDKQDNKTSSASMEGQKPGIKSKETGLFTEKEPDLQNQKTENMTQVPSEVVHSSRLSCPCSLEELSLHAKSVNRLDTDFGTETCIVCDVKGNPCWQVTLFDDTWGFLCGPCGEKLSNKLMNRN
jgi:hypothetical protein